MSHRAGLQEADDVDAVALLGEHRAAVVDPPPHSVADLAEGLQHGGEASACEMGR